MNRSKIVILLLLLCVGVLTFLLIRSNHDHNVQLNTIRVNCQYGVVQSEEINAWIKELEAAKQDTADRALQDAYQSASEWHERWNDNRLFSLGILSSMASPGAQQDSLAAIWTRYREASSGVRDFIFLHQPEAFTAAGADTLLGYMHQLSEATAEFQSFDFHE
jgi:hypothetical protein